MIRSLGLAVALLAVAAPAASAHDAEIFATNNTAVITDPADPRLQDDLVGFSHEVEGLIASGGGAPRGSTLLDGVFFSESQGTTTFERSRVFDVDGVEPDELHAIADTIRARFAQESVLTFDRLPADDPAADAIELDVPGVTAQELRDGLLADEQARTRLFGGSVTQNGHLRLVAAEEDGALAMGFAERIGGDVRRIVKRYGEREFVSGPAPVHVTGRTLFATGVSSLTLRGGRLDVDDFSIARSRFDRVRVDGGDTVALSLGGTVALAADHGRVRGKRGALEISLDGVGIAHVDADTLSVGDLSSTDTYQVDAAASRVNVEGSDDDDQISVGSFGVLAPTYVRLVNAPDALTVAGRGGDDILSTSIALPSLTLDGGDGTNVLRGGPGNDTLIGGEDFDDVVGGPGNDVARLGGDFDRFSWNPGDGNDIVDGGASRDSISVSGSSAAEAFRVSRDRGGLRLAHDSDVLALDGIEEVDAVAGGGADTFAVGDLRHTGAQLVDISLASLPITAGGDAAADRVTVDGTSRRDALKLTGKVVVAGTATLTGLAATVNISHAEPADTLVLDTRAGQDTLDTTAFDPKTIGLSILD